MQQSSTAFLVCVLSVSSFYAYALEDFEPKLTKKPTKFFKADQFHEKPSYSFAETNDDDLENPFVPPPVPRAGEDTSPWSWFLNPSVRGFTTPGEVPDQNDKKGNKADAETEQTRAQRFIGPSAIDPFFYSNPLTPPSPPRRQIPGFGYYPYELFMVVQPRQCSNATESNSTDVAIKFLSGSPNPEPSRCSFAIAACCAPFNYHVRYPCFEMLGCYGAFWDMNPCAEDVVATAVNELSTFYKSGDAPDNATTTEAPATTAAPPAPAAPAES